MLRSQPLLLNAGLEAAMGSCERDVDTVDLATNELGNLHTAESLYVLQVHHSLGPGTELLDTAPQVVDLQVGVSPVNIEPGSVKELDHVIGQGQGLSLIHM